MNVRRIIAAAISTVALLAVNVGMADTASAKGSSWNVGGENSQVKTFGSSWN
jgi:hypothetical protein